MKTPIAVAAAALALAGLAALTRAPHTAAPFPSQQHVAPYVDGPVARAGSMPQGAAAGVTPGRIVVYVAGEVARPGVYGLPSGSRVEAAVHSAGGVSTRADPLAVNLAAPLSDGEEVLVPPRGAARSYDATDSASSSGGAASGARSTSGLVGSPRVRHRASYALGRHRHGGRGGRHRKPPPSTPIDLNAADPQQLEELPGVGPSLAERIVAFRELNGPFRNTDELLDVAGMTDRRLDAISPYVVAR